MQDLKKNLRFFLLLVCASGFFKSLMAPFWIVYFNKIGFTYEQIASFVIVNHLSTLVFEIPTGVVADIYGRKLSVIISLLLGAIVPFGIYFSKSYLILLFLHLLAGIGATFTSGAFDAWFVDSLLLINKDLDLTKYWGRLTSFNYFGNTLGFLMGSALVYFRLFKEVWLIEGGGMLFIFLYTILRGQEKKLSKIHEKNNYLVFLKKILNGSTYLFKHKYLLFVVLGSCSFFFSSGIVSLLWQPYFHTLGMPLTWFGPILAITMVVSIFVPRYVDVIVRYLKKAIIFLIMSSVVCSIFLFAMLFTNKYAFIPYIVYTAIYSTHTPLIMAHLNEFIPSSERATIISAYNLSISLATVICTYLFGFLSSRFNLTSALLLATATAFLSAGFFFYPLDKGLYEDVQNKRQ